MKLRAANIDHAEAEQSIARFQEHLAHKKSIQSNLNDRLDVTRHNKLKLAEDTEIQLAIKQGLVELPTTGDASDYEDAILISKSVVEEINQIILVSRKNIKYLQLA